MVRRYGKIIRDARDARGWSQADLADLVGVEAQQVSRWERDIAPPNLNNAVELSRALDISLDELAGLIPLGLDLSGVWYAAWQTWRESDQVINTHSLMAKHHGERVRFQAEGDYDWFGDFRLSWHLLKGDYRATEPGGPATGAMLLALTADHDIALGSWSGLTGEGKLGRGWGVIARSEHDSSRVLLQLIKSPGSVTEWPIELAGVDNNAGK
ncbi:multiprotein-bridging factor 1 family protein [Nocardia sp. NPDC059246]|uniref:helix-turn-helix domain-containing protein n=1 Tax=unclassified Nocardia TaxID=2637762 RepID=UPI0036913B01